MSGTSHLPEKLKDLVAELADADRQERIELLIDLSNGLPPLPDRLLDRRDRAHRVPECQSPVFLFAEPEGEAIRLFADVPAEAPTVRGFVALLVEGLDGATVQAILDVPDDLVQRAGMLEILGMQRIHGLNGVLKRLKAQVAQASAGEAGSPLA